MAQNNIVQSSTASSDAISRTKLRHENVARLLSTVQNGGNDVRILGFLRDEFHKETLHFRD